MWGIWITNSVLGVPAGIGYNPDHMTHLGGLSFSAKAPQHHEGAGGGIKTKFSKGRTAAILQIQLEF